MGIYEDRQFERFADEVSPLHDRETARELWADGPDEAPEPEEHTGPAIEWSGEHLPTVFTWCPSTEQTEHLDDAEVVLTGPAYAPEAEWVAGHCAGCDTYLEIRVEAGVATITTEEPEEG